MMLDQHKNNSSVLNYIIIGLVWSSMVYQQINNSIHNIVSIRPLDQYIHIITCVKKYFNNIFLSCVVSQKNWSSGLESRPITNALDRARPTLPTDNVSFWSSSLDSIGGIR